MLLFEKCVRIHQEDEDRVREMAYLAEGMAQGKRMVVGRAYSKAHGEAVR